MFRADFLPFTSKIVEHSRYLPASRVTYLIYEWMSEEPSAPIAPQGFPILISRDA